MYNRENNQARKEGNTKVEPNKKKKGVTCASKGNSATKRNRVNFTIIEANPKTLLNFLQFCAS